VTALKLEAWRLRPWGFEVSPSPPLAPARAGTTRNDSHPPIWFIRDCDTLSQNRHNPQFGTSGTATQCQMLGNLSCCVSLMYLECRWSRCWNLQFFIDVVCWNLYCTTTSNSVSLMWNKASSALGYISRGFDSFLSLDFILKCWWQRHICNKCATDGHFKFSPDTMSKARGSRD
jgi:hypothetical protein